MTQAKNLIGFREGLDMHMNNNNKLKKKTFLHIKDDENTAKFCYPEMQVTLTIKKQGNSRQSSECSVKTLKLQSHLDVSAQPGICATDQQNSHYAALELCIRRDCTTLQTHLRGM